MRLGHQWRYTDTPPLTQRYVEHAWGFARCARCLAVRFYHQSGPNGGLRVTYMWQRDHKPSMPGVPRRYITTPAGQSPVPPCIHLTQTTAA